MAYQMAKFLNHHVIPHAVRCHQNPPVEFQLAVGGEANRNKPDWGIVVGYQSANSKMLSNWVSRTLSPSFLRQNLLRAA